VTQLPLVLSYCLSTILCIIQPVPLYVNRMFYVFCSIVSFRFVFLLVLPSAAIRKTKELNLVQHMLLLKDVFCDFILG